MAITAAMVKELRELSGAGMMDCKKALTETDGNMEKAVEYLREKGLAKAAKKAGRIAAEGLVATCVSEDGKTAAIVEVNSETDFVAKNDKFVTFVKQVAEQVKATSATDVEGFLAEAWALDTAKTVSEELASHKLLILYILDKINMDLTNSQMTQVVLETDIMNYFSFQQILSQLMDSKFIKPYKDSGREYYCLTQKGLESLEYFLNRIPESYAQKIDEYIKNNKESLLADTQVKSSFVKQSENEFIVNLRVIENQSNLIDLNLNVSSEKQARQICNNWNNNASNMYAEVINLLIRDIH